MNRTAHIISLLLIVLFASAAAADDQQKAQKVLDKISAMATDPTGKRAVSFAVSTTMSVPRPDIARTRHLLNINYGDALLAYSLLQGGMKIEDLTAQVRQGKSLVKIANDQHADWKSIFSNAKKANSKIDDNLLKHFAKRNSDTEHALNDGYNPYVDTVKADMTVGPDEIAEAQRRYQFLSDHSGAPLGGTLDSVSEKAAREVRSDPIRNGGPANPDTNTRPGPN
jgi:hypothetical protein